MVQVENVWDWARYAVDGATRPDSFSGMQADFSTALQRMFASAPPEIQAELRVMSGYRSPERQKELWEAALKKYGSPEIARKWVAPPGNSQHNHGNAADLRFLSPAAREWVHANAPNFGLAFPLSNEPWHIELASARGDQGGAPPPPQGQPESDYAGGSQFGRYTPPGDVVSQPGQPGQPEQDPMRLAWAYRNGKMSPEDAAMYERGIAAGVFPRNDPFTMPQQAGPDPLEVYQRVAMQRPSQFRMRA